MLTLNSNTALLIHVFVSSSSSCPALQGAHVTISARSDDDLDVDTIMTKVSKASGEMALDRSKSLTYIRHSIQK